MRDTGKDAGDAIIQEYVDYINELRAEKLKNPPLVGFRRLKKYARIVILGKGTRPTEAFGFIDLASGDILKAASWSRPAKHARGNVFDRETWPASCNERGITYLPTWRD